MTIDIKVKERTLVKPAEKTPRHSLWLSDLDLLYDERRAACIYFYKSNGASNFFDLAVLKEALARVLVPYYPVAGRLRHDDDGRLEINCNEEGVLFIVAETSSAIDDFGDLITSPELPKLTAPAPDYSAGVSSFPLMTLQITYFKCGGVSLSVDAEHRVLDGNSAFNFVNAWSEIAQGRLHLTVPPVIDRTLLRARDPPQILLNHTEYRLTDQSKENSEQDAISQHDNIVERFEVFAIKVTGDQLKILKANAKEEGYAINYSTFAILVGFIWKCASMARELPNDQETKLTFSANGRSRLQPPLPLGYFGNVIFQNRTVALAGDLQSKPLWYAVNLIHETLARLDNDYLRSVIDFLKLHPNTKRNRLDETRSPNLGITSWSKFPTRDADFGWGQPFHVGFCGIVSNEGRVWITDDVAKEGNLSVLIALQPEHVEVFEKLFYDLLKQIC